MSDLHPTSAYLAADQSAELVRRWTEPHRRYHTLDHLRFMLSTLDELRTAGVEFDAEAVELAAWFHDAVYTIPGPDNEARSAELAQSMLAGRPISTEVARLVTATATHDVTAGDRNAAALCDADLAILGASSTAYAVYRGQVRDEYAAVPSDAYRAGRTDVLRRLAGRAHLFHTAIGRQKWEEPARRNLAAELASLA